MWWPAIGGVVVGIGGYFQPRALGVGYDVISDLLHNHLGLAVVLSLLLVKAGIWIIALGSGTSGGVLAPLLMLGAGLGVVIAQLIPGSDPELWPVVCMAAVLAGVLGAPLTSAIFALGLTGDFNAMLPLLLATGVSYGFTVFAMKRSIMTEKIARRGQHIYREYSVDPLERVFAQDVMEKKPLTIEAGSTLGEVAQNYFGAVQKYRSFPVIDSHGQVLGILDRKMLVDGHAALGDAADVASIFDGVTLHYALVTESCQVIGRRMAMHRLERLPVIADPASMKLLGIISRSDLIKPSHSAFQEEHVRERLLDARLRKRS
jgi:CBS domain-containing protein